MERTFYVLIILMLSVCRTHAKAYDLDSAIAELDRAIKKSPEYVRQKQETIDRLTTKLTTATDSRARFRMCHELFEEYLAFSNDSALHYISQCINLARQAGSTPLVGECQAEMAFQYSNTGMYDESLYLLRQIDAAALDRTGLAAYYHAYNHLYSEMAFYTHEDTLRQQYRQMAQQYEQQLLANVDSTSLWALQRREMTFMDQGLIDKSLDVNNQWMQQVKRGTHPYALTTFYRYLEFRNHNDSIQMMYWLIESAVSDVRNAIMDQGSMWELANLLMAQGDIDRAYRYISFAANCATRFGTRLRSWQLSPILTAIDSKYQQYHERDKLRTRIFLAILGLLTLFLAFTLYRIWLQHQKLRQVHERVHEQNVELSTVNAQLSTLNAQLSNFNAQLSTANTVKEEYVAHFMRLCSMYIDKMDAFRKRVNKMVKNHEYEDLYQLTRSQEFRDKELEDLYVSFDSAFLHLFPNFVNDFNALLRPEYRIATDEKGRLNTSLRIFALIRLGLDDSSKIAEFLNYSVNTIYNYRARIKNGALNNRDDFEQNVLAIGTFGE